MSKLFEPHFKTPLEAHSKEEVNKRNSNGMRGTLGEEYRSNEAEDLSWEAEQLSKSYGIYLEFNRAKTGKEKDWVYMIRLGIPGGGPITPAQWTVIDDVASKYGRTPEGQPSIRLTTRENVQFHWVHKLDVIPLVRECAEAGLLSLNGCGDNVRNIMSCPLGPVSPDFNPRELAWEAAKYFQLPVGPYLQIFAIDPNAVPEETSSFEYGPQLLNRKFKIAFSTVHRDPVSGQLVPDNCVELRTNDMGVAPVIEENRIVRFQIYIGGGQGEKVGKPTAAMLAEPLGQVSREQLLRALDAVVAVHQEWGDRENRHWARLKYVVKKMGVAWFRERVEERLGFALGDPDQDLDIGDRHLHHGWVETKGGKLAYGAFIECGRLVNDARQGALREMVSTLAREFDTPLVITPNQDLIFTELAADRKQDFERRLADFGFDRPVSELRRQSGACVGRDTCRLAYTDSEKFEPELMDALEGLGWGEVATSVGITGCERQCFRPATKVFGLIGSGSDRYHLKLMGTEDARHQGIPLEEDGLVYLRSVPRERVADLLDALLRQWRAEAQNGESVGYFLRRKGIPAILASLRENPDVAELLEKPQKSTALAV